MTPKEYNAMPEGDTKLTVRLAITMGWHCVFAHQTHIDHYEVGDLLASDPKYVFGFRNKKFNPFTDPSIPYGLIGRGVHVVAQLHSNKAVASAETHLPWSHAESKTHAIINAFCAADPMGHWSRFIKGGE
jgi:hypothetical protein